jgi:1,4-alpha-glucan branching enzyme
MVNGYLSLILHAHLPFIKHPERPKFSEEEWLFEALTESYIPLLLAFGRMETDRVPFRLTLSISPVLAEMLADSFLQSRYVNYLQDRIDLCLNEVSRTSSQPDFQPLAQMYLEFYRSSLSYFENQCHRQLLTAIDYFEKQGFLELLTCPATHAFLPLISKPEAKRAQILIARQNHKHHFGKYPRGIWLAECGYEPSLDPLLQQCGFEYFILDSHGILYGNPCPPHVTFAPCRTSAGLSVFGRDIESSWQVWNLHHGYPGDFHYREFYRDLGHDAEYEYIKPYLHDDGVRRNLGIKYYRITGPGDLSQRQPYQPDQAREKVASHAGHFLSQRWEQVGRLNSTRQITPQIVCPYDAELFGHWWFEGPQFLEAVFRQAASRFPKMQFIHLSEYLCRHPAAFTLQPAASTWGADGFNRVWLNESNHWIYRHQHWAEEKMVELAYLIHKPNPWQQRALNQAARELLLAQSSDWAFMMARPDPPFYPTQRFRDHIERFTYIQDAIIKGAQPLRLEAIERQDSLFPHLQSQVYRQPIKN